MPGVAKIRDPGLHFGGSVTARLKIMWFVMNMPRRHFPGHEDAVILKQRRASQPGKASAA